MSTKEAHRLIKELETIQIRTLNDQVSLLAARLEVLQKEEKRSWNEFLKDFLKSGNRGLLHRAIPSFTFYQGPSGGCAGDDGDGLGREWW